MKQVTMESVKQRIADLESAGKVVGGLSLSSEFELACLRELVAVTEHSERVSKSLETALGVQADQAKRTNQLLGEIKKAEAVIGSLGWMGLDTAISLELTKLNKQISDLQGQVRLLTEQRDAVVVEMASLKEVIREVNKTAEECELNGDELRYVVGTDEFERLTDILDETPAHDAAIAALRAEAFNDLCKAFVLHKQSSCLDDNDKVSVREATDALLHCAEQLSRQLRESKGANHE